MPEEQKPVEGASQQTEIQTEPQAGTTQSTPISNEDYQKLLKELENSKKEISGLNRKISEDEKTLKQKELENLKGIERERAELELIKAEKEKIAREAEELRRSRIVDKALTDMGIPLEFAKHISGSDELEILQNVKEVSDYVDKLVNQRVEKIIAEKLSGKAPVIGNIPVNNDLQSQYNKAKEQGNFTLQNAIKRKASAEGIELKE